jgi:acetoin utilization protein AcuB
MKVSKIMSTRVVTVTMDTTLDVVANLFASSRFHHLLVVDGLKLVGVVSDRDLLKAMTPKTGSEFATDKDNACLHKKVHQVMSRDPVVVNQNQSILSAVRIFNQHKISVLPVVDNQQHWVGVLSWRDIFRQIEHYYAKPE